MLFAKKSEFIYFAVGQENLSHFMFITFEGLDYSGKSTQVRLLADTLKHENYSILVLREPGGTEIGERIRTILLDKRISGMTGVSELFLFSASRAQLVEEVIKPAIEGGLVVICDRFYDSLTVYQGWGKGVPLETIRVVNASASSGLAPDLTFFLDIPVEEVERRMRRSHTSKDRMESNGRAFYERVREGYLHIATTERRFRVIDGLQPVDAIQDLIWKTVNDALRKK
jgi:dTMP kinase